MTFRKTDRRARPGEREGGWNMCRGTLGTVAEARRVRGNVMVHALFLLVSLIGLLASPVAAATPIPADPWPRQVAIPGATVLVYQPQVSSWVGNTLDFRAAVAIKPT